MKRQTKAQKEAAEKAALLQRLNDIYSGASGGVVQADDEVYAETIRKVMVVVKDLWVGDEEDRQFLIAHWNVDEYGTVEKAAEFLHGHGVRA
jgi:hypothetical protein